VFGFDRPSLTYVRTLVSVNSVLLFRTHSTFPYEKALRTEKRLDLEIMRNSHVLSSPEYEKIEFNAFRLSVCICVYMYVCICMWLWSSVTPERIDAFIHI
jgi:hypothetical protein